MSTRSYIIVRAAGGTYRRIYCHFDGYLEGVGATLINYHDSDASAQAIVNLGDLSSLNRRLDAGMYAFGLYV